MTWTRTRFSSEFDSFKTFVIHVCSITVPAGGDGKTETPTTPAPSAEVNAGSDKVLGVSVAPTSVTGKLAGTVLSPRMTTALELKNPPSVNAKTSPTTIPQPGALVPPEAWMLV